MIRMWRNKGQYDIGYPVEIESPEHFLHLIKCSGNRGRKLYIICDGLADTFTANSFWSLFENGHLVIDGFGNDTSYTLPNGKIIKRKPSPFILSRSCEMIGFRTDCNMSVKCISYRNHIKMSLGRMYIESVGDIHESRMIDNTDDSVVLTTSERCKAIVYSYRELFNQWHTNNCGSWSDTLSGLGMSWFRQSEGFYPILKHDFEDVQDLESASAFGGTSRVFYFGDVTPHRLSQIVNSGSPKPSRFGRMPSHCHKFDCRAMYASILQSCKMPVEYIGKAKTLKPKELLKVAEHCCVIARVHLKPKTCVYPYRWEENVWHPTGEFITTLTTPELVQAIRNGEVTSVLDARMYQSAPCFERVASEMIRLRSSMKESGKTVLEAVLKGIANSFTGRLAMNARTMKPRPNIHPVEQWGHFIHSAEDGGECREYRAIAGHAFELSIAEHKPGGTTAIYSHITAYGRVIMNQIREIAGSGNVIAQDVDGVWVNDDGRSRLIDSIWYDPDSPGKLRYEGTSEWSRFVSPKHYYHDGLWTLSGIHNPSGIVHDGIVYAEVIVNPIHSGNDPSACPLRVIRRKVNVERIPLSDFADDSGFATPIRVTDSGVVTPPKPFWYQEE